MHHILRTVDSTDAESFTKILLNADFCQLNKYQSQNGYFTQLRLRFEKFEFFKLNIIATLFSVYLEHG